MMSSVPRDLLLQMSQAKTAEKKRQKLTQGDLAKMAGVSVRTVASIEAGSMSVAAGSYVLLLFTLGLSVVVERTEP